MRRITPLILILLTFALGGVGCGGLGSTSQSHGVTVVAAESTWGSVAQALAGNAAHVTSIISNPALDPHSYEPEAADARAFATAQLVIVNGLGYDGWASRLLAADSPSGRSVINVGAVLGLHTGDNPHRWYAPADVHAVANAITAALIHTDPANARYFRAQRIRFDTVVLADYHRSLSEIQHRYPGAPVGASESIFAPLAGALGLRLITPPSFLRAISEGGLVTASDMSTIQSQIAHRSILVWVLNTQNETPDVNVLTAAAVAAHIPIVSMTEMPNPGTATFADWQTRQLIALAAALHHATGR